MHSWATVLLGGTGTPHSTVTTLADVQQRAATLRAGAPVLSSVVEEHSFIVWSRLGAAGSDPHASDAVVVRYREQ